MAKKRNKRYQGDDAKRQRPKVKKVVVEDKSRLQRWYEDNKNEIKIKGVQIGLVAIVGFIVWGVWTLIA
jgi:hypothetical protein